MAHKRQFAAYITDEVRENFESVAQAAHMEPTKYASVWIQELSTLKPEFALKALGMIPAEWKHRRPGRPSAAARADSKPSEVTVEDVA